MHRAPRASAARGHSLLRLRHRVDTLGVSWLDFKLGFRMLVKYPGLTLVGGLALAFAIAVGAGAFDVVTQMTRPTLPLPQGDRIVGLQLWNAAEGRAEPRLSHDVAVWRETLRSVREVGAFRTRDRNLVVGPGGHGQPVAVAEVSASGFRLTRVPPLLGRTLIEADEQPGAPPVLVLGHDVWQARFGSDAGVVGRAVWLGGTPTTVVGVMPAGYAFPVAHRLWVPLRLDVLGVVPGEGPALTAFGRLAPDVSLDEAQAELAALGRRMAADFPQSHEHLRPRVLPYAQAIMPLGTFERTALHSLNAVLALFLVLVGGNVAMLVFARAASREGEIVVRAALGASRGRIVMQLFAEAFVLGGVAALVGLIVAGIGLRAVMAVFAAEAGGRVPFWFSERLSPTTILYAGALTLLVALVTGVLPALKVTRGLGARLKQMAAGGGGLRFGGVWTAVIVTQVAVTVAFPAVAFFVRRNVVQLQSLDVGFPAREYLSARLEPDTGAAPAADTALAARAAAVGATLAELERRLEAEPQVAGATFVTRLPRTHHPQRWVETDADGLAPADSTAPGHGVTNAAMALDYFDVLGARVLAGRGFDSGDLAADARAVIVNQSFVRDVLGGRNPVGHRVRYVEHVRRSATAPLAVERSAWYTIVGMVPDLGMVADEPTRGAGVYHPMSPGTAEPIHLVVHVRGTPAPFAPRLRTVAAAVDPGLRVQELLPLDLVGADLWMEFALLFRILAVVSAVAVMLSLAGIYAVMAFTLARRTREIGIRVALGASASRVVLAIFRRPLVQVGLGVAAGGALTAALTFAVSHGTLSASQLGLVLTYAALMLGVCLLACVVPTRRALRVEPTEALRADG